VVSGQWPVIVTEDYFIRAATAEDAPEILKCLARAFEPYRSSYTPGAWNDTVLSPETIQQRLESMRILVAVSQDGAVGTIACGSVSADEGHLRGMAVLPSWQGQGVAEALLQAAEAELMMYGCKRITLDTTEPLQRAMRFYEKHGYRRSGMVTDFFGMRLHEFIKDLE
jgi:ribosomal protein S18 acetylase RimI-like enzyme